MPLPAYPPNFDVNIARQLGQYVDSAYAQYKNPATPPPPGLADVFILSAIETWKTPHFSILGFGAATPPVTMGFVASQGNDFYIVIRGTITPLEWLDDVTIAPAAFPGNPAKGPWGSTSQGFLDIYNQLWPQITAQVKRTGRTPASPGNIYVTGHSLGAAVAHLVVAGLYNFYNIVPVSYTFSGPRTGDPVFAQAFAAAGLGTWRIFNTEDIVPTVPFAAIQIALPNLGMATPGSLAQFLPLLVSHFPQPYQHIGAPLAVTFHHDDIAGNHNLTQLYHSL
jgi:hypothetical protein